MSDKELVTIDKQQFTVMEQRLNAVHAELQMIRERLGPADTKLSLHQVLSHIERTLHTGLQVLAANSGGGDNSEVLTAINNLDRKVTTMSSNIDRIEKEAADAAENVGLVRTAIEELKTISTNMQTEITALKEQVAQGQIDQARLEAAAATFEKADEDMDALVLPSTPPEGGGGGGETGGGEGGAGRAAR